MAHLPRNINWGSSSFISHLDEGQNLALAEFTTLLLELVSNKGYFTRVNRLEKTTRV
jgi:hypothetical protein